ncbi:MAG: imidazole glycerol phosphate synthase subunit HisH [Candidatus Omnitrophica bacterium]|nr:imidazole glycerol phosphate synthase subunit HisH [Candidatus Omnitrophota bacterium]
MPNAKSPDAVIIDYGVGNLFNVQRALDLLGASSVISGKPEDILSAKKLILPGVGAFEAGMRYLNERGLVSAIRKRAAEGCPVLGICLGMQLLMTHSEEGGSHDGLNLIAGKVRRFQAPNNGQSYKIPQIGWNRLTLASKGGNWRDTLLNGLDEAPCMYFVHSYCVYPESAQAWLAQTEYGQDRFCSVLLQDNIQGCQFHPERSGEMGLRILKNFISKK